MSLAARLVIALALLGCAGCALTSKSDSIVLRYFSPVTVTQRTTAAQTDDRRAPPEIALRLGRVNGARHLKEKIAYRDSAYELAFYDELRWTDKPEAFVRRALRGALFEEHRARQLVGGGGLTLDVDLDAFEEIKAPRHAARVSVTWTLRDDQLVLAEESFLIERAFAPRGEGDGPAALVAALSGALDDAVARIVARVLVSAQAGSTPAPRTPG